MILTVLVDNNTLIDRYFFAEPVLSFLLEDSGIRVLFDTEYSHSGICNITEYAKEVCGDSRVLDIVSGFHLLEPSEERMRGTLEYLKKLDPGCVHACHCTDLNSKIELSKVCRLKEVGVGLQIEYF